MEKEEIIKELQSLKRQIQNSDRLILKQQLEIAELKRIKLNPDKLKLIVLESSKDLGLKVDSHLKKMFMCDRSFIVPVKEPWFSDGHGKVVLQETVRDKDVFIFQDVGNYSIEYEMHGMINHTSPNDLAQQLKDVIGACKCHTSGLSVIMPLLFAGRQHRRINREPLSCATYLGELDSDQHVKRIITFDAHDEGVQQALRDTEFDNFYATNQLLEQFINDAPLDQLKDVLFVAPDFGATGRMNFYLNAFSSPHILKDAGIFYKRRDYNTVKDGKNPVIEHSYTGSDNIQGKTAIVVDDMISSGGSMFDVIEELRKRGIKHIYIFVTYSLFTKGIDRFKELYDKGMFDGIYTTNLSYIDKQYLDEPWLHIVDCSLYLAKIIYNFHNEMSISDLQNNRSYPGKVLAKKFEKK